MEGLHLSPELDQGLGTARSASTGLGPGRPCTRLGCGIGTGHTVKEWGQRRYLQGQWGRPLLGMGRDSRKQGDFQRQSGAAIHLIQLTVPQTFGAGFVLMRFSEMFSIDPGSVARSIGRPEWMYVVYISTTVLYGMYRIAKPSPGPGGMSAVCAENVNRSFLLPVFTLRLLRYRDPLPRLAKPTSAAYKEPASSIQTCK